VLGRPSEWALLLALVSSVFKGLGSWLRGGGWPCIGGRVSAFRRPVLGAVGSNSVIVPKLTAFFFGGAIVGFLLSS
jgi:hypothetical protein